MTALHLGLKTAAMVCQMIPVYQPALGSAGQGMNLLSDLDPDNPWPTITGGLNLATNFLASNFGSASAQVQATNASINTQSLTNQTTRFDYLGALNTAMSGLQSGITNIRGFLAQNEAPSADMLAELESLKASDTNYQALATRIEALMLEQRKYADQLLATMTSVAGLSDLINRDILAIDAMDPEISDGYAYLDGRASAYLDDMKRRAFDRLLKYHYYMAKAYEYRLLQPYANPLNLEALFEEFSDLADRPGATNQLSQGDFESLFQIYHEPLRDVATNIWYVYETASWAESLTNLITLQPQQLAALNRGEALTMNLVDAGKFDAQEENLRILDINVWDIGLVRADGTPFDFDDRLDLNIEHSGVSTLKTSSSLYLFRHYNRDTRNPLRWEIRVFPYYGTIVPSGVSPDSQSMLWNMLDGVSENVALFSRPGVWADLTLTAEIPYGQPRPLVANLTLEVAYEFVRRPTALRQLDIAAVNGTNWTSAFDALTVAPLFTVSPPDLAGRSNGVGQITRIYNRYEHVSVTAPQYFDHLVFDKWTDDRGNPLPNGGSTNIQFVDLDHDPQIRANYVLKITPPVLTIERVTPDSLQVFVDRLPFLPYTYQWTYSGTNLPGATNATYIPPGRLPTGLYGVVVWVPVISNIVTQTYRVATDWLTTNLAGSAGTITTASQLDAAVQLLAATSISTSVALADGDPPLATSNAVWSTAGYFQTRPANVGATILMARLLNETGANVNGVNLGYDFTTVASQTEEVAGHRVYYSLTGLPNDWTAVPALCSRPPGHLTARPTFSGQWRAGDALYLLWADANGSSTPNTALQIRNFSFAPVQVPLTVIITSPTNGQTFVQGRAVTIDIATPILFGELVEVDFIDNGSPLGTVEAPPYRLTYTGTQLGPHTLFVVARDDLFNFDISPSVDITIHTNNPPTIAITQPADGASFLVGTNAVVQTTSSDPDGTVQRVEFYVDGPFAFTNFDAYPGFTLGDLTAGPHTITAVAVDDLGMRGTNTISITGTNPSDFTVLVANGERWRYLDDGSNPDAAGIPWRWLFDDQSWPEGPAELGYGDAVQRRPERTVVGYGPNPAAKHATTYFRKLFVVESPGQVHQPACPVVAG